MSVNKRESNYITYETGGKTYTRKEIQAGELGKQEDVDWTKVSKTLTGAEELLPWEDAPRIYKSKLTSNVIKEALQKSKISESEMQFLSKNIGMPVLINEVIYKPGTALHDELVEMMKAQESSSITLKGIYKNKIIDVGSVELVEQKAEPSNSWADEVEGLNDEKLEVHFKYGFPAIGSSSVQENKTFQPHYAATPIDKLLYDTLYKILHYGKYPTIEGLEENEVHDRLLEFYNDLRRTSEEYWCGTSGPLAQLGRYKAVLKVSANRKELPLTYKQYSEIQNRLNPLNPATDISLKTLLISHVEEQFEQKFGIPLNHFNMGADAGLLWQAGVVRGVILTQDYMLAAEMLRCVGTEEFKKFAGWVELTEFKAKTEVYTREELTTKNRNYMPFNSFAMLPAMTIYNLTHYEPPRFGDQECIVMNNFSVFNGKFDEFIVEMINRAKKRNFSAAVYADNLYLTVNEDGDIYFYSLDGVKFEGSSTRTLIAYENKRQIEALKAAGVQIDKRWEQYYVEMLPNWIVDGVTQWGPKQFKLKQMASGTIGTFAYNTALMICLVDQFLKSDQPIVQKGKFTKNAESIMENMGIHLIIEKSFNLSAPRSRLEVAPFDLLGFDGVFLNTEGTRVVWVPVLQEQRLLNSQVYLKSQYSDNEAKQALVDFSRHYAFYIMGNWMDPARSYVNMRCMTSALKEFIGSGLSGVKATRFIRQLKAEVGDDDVGTQIAALLDTFLVKGELPIITIPHLFKLLTGYRDDDVTSFLEKNKIDPSGIWTVRRKNTKRLVVRIEKFVPFIHVMKSLDPEPSKFLTYTVKPSLKGTTKIKKEKKKPKEYSAEDLLPFNNWIARLKSEGITYEVVPYVPESYRGEEITNIGTLWANFASQIAAHFKINKSAIRSRTSELMKIFKLKANPYKYPSGQGSNELFVRQDTAKVYLFPSYSHKLYMSQSITRFTVDYNYYKSRGITEEALKSYIQDDKPIPDLDLPTHKSGKEKLKVEVVDPKTLVTMKPSLVMKTDGAGEINVKVPKEGRTEKKINAIVDKLITNLDKHSKVMAKAGEEIKDMLENRETDDKFVAAVVKKLTALGEDSQWLARPYNSYAALIRASET